MPPGKKGKGRKKNRKGKKRSDSESSTPQSSTPSVEDNQQLLQDGACGSSESGSAKETKKTVLGKGSPSRSSGESPLNNPQSSRSLETKHPDVPQSQASPSKSSILSGMKKLFPQKSKSPNRSPAIEAAAKDTSMKMVGNESKSSSSSESPSISKPSSNSDSRSVSKNNTGGTQSSSSSDPNVSEHSRNAAESEQPPEKGFLTVPGQESEVRSSSKKSPVKLMFRKLIPKKSPNRSSDTKGGCEGRADQEMERPKPKKHETGAKSKHLKVKAPIRSVLSETSSSSGSPIISKHKGGDETCPASEESSFSDSKLPSNSDPNVLETDSMKGSSDNSSSRKTKRRSKVFRNPKECDPQEGTSGGPARNDYDVEQSGGIDLHNRWWMKYVSELSEEEINEGTIPIIEHMDEDPPFEGNRQGSNLPVPRPRSKSVNHYLLRLQRPRTSRQSSPQRFNLRELNVMLGPDIDIPIPGFEWPWLAGIRVPRPPLTERNIQEIIEDSNPDGDERGLLEEVEYRFNRRVSRHESLSPEPTPRSSSRGSSSYELTISRQIELRFRRGNRRCKHNARIKKL